MIKQFIFLFALLLPLSVSAQAQHKLSAQIMGLEPGITVFLSNVDNPNKAETLDSAKVAADGSFSLAMPLQKPRMCNVTFWKAGKTRSYKISSLSLLLDGSEDVILKGDTAQLFSTDRETILGINGGGKTLADWLDYKRYIQKQQDVADDASYREADAFFANGGDKSKFRNLIVAKGREAARLDSMQTVWMEGHASTAAAAYLLGWRYYQSFTYPKDVMAKWIDEVTANNADTARVAFLKHNRDVVLGMSLNIPYPDFSATTKAGKVVNFSSLVPKGKYTLIDFWASWCGPCRAAIPHVKKMYTEQNGRLNVVSISVDQREADWRKAEKQEAMPWTQLWLNKTQLNKAALAYDIQSIPRLVLINPEGKIQLVTFDPDKIEAALTASAGNTFTIHSAIPGMTEGAEVRLQAADSHDSIAYGKVTNGQFTLTGKVAAPVLCTLEIDNRVKPLPEGDYMHDRVVKLYLDNDDYTVSAAAYDSIPRSYEMGESPILGENRYTVKGGKSQEQYQAWHDAVWPSLKAAEEANVKAWHYLYGGKEFGDPEHPDKAVGERMSLTADSLKAIYQQHSDDYAWAHPTEPYSLYLQGKNLDRHFYYTAAQLDEMTTRFRGNSDATGYAAFVKKIAEAKKTAKDMAYPDVTLRTVDGKAVKLSSLVKPGKYTLLDFWASWCGPCRASIPLIKEMHARHPELNIVSISCDKSLKDWEDAMKEEKMSWQQAALPQDKQLARAAAAAYHIQFIPYLIVISPDGKVVKASNDAKDIARMW